VLIDDRDEVVSALNRAQIYPGVHYRDNTLYSMYHASHGTCPNAAYASDHLLSLPIHLRLTREDVERVAQELKAAVRERVY
jgi:dTDP-4-amino-4,6-dideoxygalactose transaminase